MPAIIFKSSKYSQPSLSTLTVKFPNNKLYKYSVPKTQLSNLKKVTSNDTLLFDSPKGFSQISAQHEKSNAMTQREVEVSGAMYVNDPIAFRKQWGLPQLENEQAEIESQYKAVCLLSNDDKKEFFDKVKDYYTRNRENKDLTRDDIPNMNPIFGTQAQSYNRNDYKGIEITFSNGEKATYVYAPETAPLLTISRALGDTIYFDRGMNKNVCFDKPVKNGDFRPSNPFLPIKIKPISYASPFAHELVFRGAANVKEPSKLREILGYGQLPGYAKRKEEDHYALYVGNIYYNKENVLSVDEFLHRTKFIYNLNKELPTKSVTKDDLTEIVHDQPKVTEVIHDQSEIKHEKDKTTNSKYRLIEDDYKIVRDESRVMSVDKKVYRIEALKNFSDVKKGDKGGYVQSLTSIGQSGKAWVYDDAIVSGTATVTGDATVKGNSHIHSMVKLRKNASIIDQEIINKRKYILYIENDRWKPEEVMQQVAHDVISDENTLDKFLTPNELTQKDITDLHESVTQI